MYVLSVIGSHNFIPASVKSLVVVFQLKTWQNELSLDAVCKFTIKLNNTYKYEGRGKHFHQLTCICLDCIHVHVLVGVTVPDHVKNLSYMYMYSK